jgi:hypothetical protein
MLSEFTSQLDTAMSELTKNNSVESNGRCANVFSKKEQQELNTQFNSLDIRPDTFNEVVKYTIQYNLLPK